MNQDVAPILRPKAADHAASALQAITSTLDIISPGIGSLFGTLINEVIPGQRNERIAEYVTRLSRRLAVAEGWLLTFREQHEQLQTSARTTDDLVRAVAFRFSVEQRALFEDGAISATRATREERLTELVGLVAEGLATKPEDDLLVIQKRRILALLSSLDTNEMAALRIYEQSPRIVKGDGATNTAHTAFMSAHQEKLMETAGSSTIALQSILARLRTVGALKTFSFSTDDPSYEVHHISQVGEELVRAVNEAVGA